MRKVKSLILSWIYRAAVSVHPCIGIYIVNRTLPWGRPTLDYLEFHLADHCNLNCAGCLHYSPFADKRFANLETVRSDLLRLKELFANIRHIRIMGGEPLLHPDAVKFAETVRGIFPRCHVRVVTNGILLGSFTGLSDLARLNVGIDWTMYPPMATKELAIRERCTAAGVDLRITEGDAFMARLLPTGGEGALKSFRWCRRMMYCPFLDSGRIYPCASSRFAAYYNRAAGTKIFEEPGIDFHRATAKEIMLYLMRPTFACSYCAASARTFSWKQCQGPEDWVR